MYMARIKAQTLPSEKAPIPYNSEVGYNKARALMIAILLETFPCGVSKTNPLA